MTDYRLLKALRREAVDCTPVWLMRQAGRYLPEYRRVRAQAGDFVTLCKTPDLACRVTLQPLERFDLDAAIVFSDILTIPDAMGLGLTLEEGFGPRFARPVRTAADISRLGVPDPEQELTYVMQTIRQVRRELNGRVPLIGFSGSPWTLATYMVEGESSRSFKRIKSLIYERPRDAHRLLGILAEAVAAYLSAQVAAGAQALMLFDTWGGILTTPGYQDFSLQYARRVIGALKATESTRPVPVILFTKGGGLWLESQADSGCEALGLDWTVNVSAAVRRTGGRVALQGNLDPVCMLAGAAAIRREVARILDDAADAPGHVFNLGHGVTPDVPPENVAVLVDAVHRLSARGGRDDATHRPQP